VGAVPGGGRRRIRARPAVAVGVPGPASADVDGPTGWGGVGSGAPRRSYSTCPPPSPPPVLPSPPVPPGDGSAAGGELDQLEPLAVYGDAAYGAGKLLETLEAAGAQISCKVQPPTAPAGRFAKDQFAVDVAARTVRCPAGVTTTMRPAGTGTQVATFGSACASCPLAAQCTDAKAGRTISIGPHEERLTRARTAQRDPAWPGSGLPGDPPESGTQDRSPDAPPAWRPAAPGPRQNQDCRGLLAARRRRQPRPTSRAQPFQHRTGKLDSSIRLREERDGQPRRSARIRRLHGPTTPSRTVDSQLTATPPSDQARPEPHSSCTFAPATAQDAHSAPAT